SRHTCRHRGSVTRGRAADVPPVRIVTRVVGTHDAAGWTAARVRGVPRSCGIQARMRRIVVTIDGPAGAGKSTVAKQLARRLGYRLLDTGAIYRAVALLAKRNGVPWTDAAACAAVAR